MNKILMFWAILFTLAILPNTIRAQEAYTVVKDGTLTFYYDNNKPTRDGKVYDIAAEYTGKDNYPLWQSADIKKGVFDQSFVNYTPSSTARWFHSCSGITEINNIAYLNTSVVKSMGGMFYGCSSLEKIDLTGFNTSCVVNMSSMFYECSKLESLDLSAIDTKNVTNLVAMFYGCSALKEINVSSFNTKKVDDMEYLFFGCSKLASLDLTSFNTEKVTNMEGMFAKCSNLVSVDLSSFNTSSVTNMVRMFTNCTNLCIVYVSEDWSTESVTDSSWMFWDVGKLVGGEGTKCDGIGINPIDHRYARLDKKSEESPGYFTYKPSSSINSILMDGDENAGYYSLDGKWYNNFPRKGINIINGKKIIVR